MCSFRSHPPNIALGRILSPSHFGVPLRIFCHIFLLFNIAREVGREFPPLDRCVGIWSVFINKQPGSLVAFEAVRFFLLSEERSVVKGTSPTMSRFYLGGWWIWNRIICPGTIGSSFIVRSERSFVESWTCTLFRCPKGWYRWTLERSKESEVFEVCFLRPTIPLLSAQGVKRNHGWGEGAMDGESLKCQKSWKANDNESCFPQKIHHLCPCMHTLFKSGF